MGTDIDSCIITDYNTKNLSRIMNHEHSVPLFISRSWHFFFRTFRQDCPALKIDKNGTAFEVGSVSTEHTHEVSQVSFFITMHVLIRHNLCVPMCRSCVGAV